VLDVATDSDGRIRVIFECPSDLLTWVEGVARTIRPEPGKAGPKSQRSEAIRMLLQKQMDGAQWRPPKAQPDPLRALARDLSESDLELLADLAERLLGRTSRKRPRRKALRMSGARGTAGR